MQRWGYIGHLWAHALSGIIGLRRAFWGKRSCCLPGTRAFSLKVSLINLPHSGCGDLFPDCEIIPKSSNLVLLGWPCSVKSFVVFAFPILKNALYWKMTLNILIIDRCLLEQLSAFIVFISLPIESNNFLNYPLKCMSYVCDSYFSDLWNRYRMPACG